jgi:murein DD-endopeptidase MepM/ murein hydrolase activator NlpD
MTSLHPDRLTTEGAAPTPGTRRTRSQAPGKTSRTAAASDPVTASVKPRGTAPAPRSPRGTSRAWAAAESSSRLTERAKAARGVTEKTAQVARTATATAARTASATAKAAGTRAAAARTAAAARKAATPKATAPRATGPKAATTKAPTTKATAKPAGAKPTATKAAGAKATARAASSAKPAAAKAAPATAATAKPATKLPSTKTARSKASADPSPEAPGVVVAPAPVRRPTPYKRTEVAADAVPAPVVDVEPPADEAPVPATSAGLHRLRRRLPSVRRRPGIYLAAVLVGALSISAASAGDTTAMAETGAVHESVSVAEALGIEAEEAQPIVSAETTDRLGELVASRAERDEAELHAARLQKEADEEAREEAERAAAAAAEAARPKAVAPVKGARFTSGFGARWGTLHAGIDLAAPIGTPEYAAMDGVVLEAGPASGFGLAVYIQHENGDVTVYGHMEQILVRAGQVVKAGDTIALLGNRGQSTGPHLHFEVHQGGLDGTKIDPVPWLAARGVKV